MKEVKESTIRDFYNNVPEIWAKNDYWHQYSHRVIENYLHKQQITRERVVLNAGSAGNSYGIDCDMYHVDIAEKKLVGIKNAYVASIEKLPFSDQLFDDVICVGSVINYCDAAAAISEFARVLKPSGRLILEFENSAGFEYRGKAVYSKSADIVTVKFQGHDHTQWLFSKKYILSLMQTFNFKVTDEFGFHILSALALNLSQSESSSVRYTKVDPVLRRIPYFANHANNVILSCEKL